jgi:hypothetical protein
MNYIKIVVLMAFVLPTFVESAHVSVRWMRPTAALASAIEMAKITQGPDRLIAGNGFINTKTVFARINDRVLPFLPENTSAFEERQEILQQKQRDLEAANNLDYWKRCTMTASLASTTYGLMCDGSWFYYPVFIGVPYGCKQKC